MEIPRIKETPAQLKRASSYSKIPASLLIKDDQSGNNDFMSPEREKSKKLQWMGSPILTEKKTSTKSKAGSKKKKKFSVTRQQMKQKNYFDRISEERSSEVSVKNKKEDQEISSIQKNNQSQPAEGNYTAESMISGMEARSYE